MSQIASVSLARPLEEIADERGRSFAEYGFGVVRDHGIPQDLIARAEEMSKAFFALPDATKRQYKIEGGGGARGYTPFGTEKAKDAEGKRGPVLWNFEKFLLTPDGTVHRFRPTTKPDDPSIVAVIEDSLPR